MSNELISKSLGVQEVYEGETPKEIVTVNSQNTAISGEIVDEIDRQADEDFELARNNIRNIISKGDEALDEILDVARASEQARAFEVFSTLMKNLVEANKDLVDLTRQKKEERKLAQFEKKKQEENSDSGIGQQNNIFVGSTKELQDLLKGMKDKL